jgi:photosystem II stability/assembly factor-like uncharacterized protein
MGWMQGCQRRIQGVISVHIGRLAAIRASALFAGLVLALCEAQSPTAALAGVNTWTALGPEGGYLCALAVAPSDPAVVYAAGSGLHRSADGGATWEPTGATVGSVSCLLAVDAVDPLRLYALHPDRVERSLDGGTTWETTQSGISAASAHFPIAVSPADPDFLLFSDWDKIYRSLDRGDSWEEIPALQGTWLASMAIHPGVPGRAFAVAQYSAVHISDDYGATWAPLGESLPGGVTNETLHFDPNDPSLFYLMTRFGLYRSRDEGGTWLRVLPSSSNLVAGVLAILPDSTLYSLQTETHRKFLLRSRDEGDTWVDLGTPFPERPTDYFLDFEATSGALLVAGSGIVCSTDGGASWQPSSGLRASRVQALTLDRQNPERLFALRPYTGSYPNVLDSYPTVILGSLDRGSTWIGLAFPPELGDSVLADFTVDPNDAQHFLVATDSRYGRGFQGVASSFDAGETWSSLPLGAECFFPVALGIDPLRSSRLFYLGGPEAFFCRPVCDAFLSEDSGESWECIGIEENADALIRMAPSPFEPGVVLAIGTAAIYRSQNSGRDWTVVAAPPDFSPYDFSDVAWASAQVAYATSAGFGLFWSGDGGSTWQPRLPFPDGTPGGPWLTSLAVDPFRSQTIYALLKTSAWAVPREVVRSTDGGLSWSSLSDGLLGWWLSDLTIDPVTPNRLYVSAEGGGVLAYDVQVPEPCVPSTTALCITDGRFKVESLWRDFAGGSGVGHAVPLASDTGSFWFFDPDNLELFVKEIDGVSFNNAFWTFYGALSNVEFTVLATDTATGAQHGYFNPIRTFASRGDIESFPQEEGFALPAGATATSTAWMRPRAMPLRSANACLPDATTLCLADGRFAASVTWRDFAGRRGVGTPIVLTPDTGSFWFFDAGIHELAVKVIDGRGTNDAFWVFYGSLSNVEFELTVVDTETGDSWTRENPSGTFASGGDIEAFPQ